MPKIVISYRRSDSQAMAGRVFDRLSAHFGDDSVFMDIDKVPIGIDFRQYIREELHNADMLLAVIGPRWLGPREGGQSRIHDRADPVRVELEIALEQKLPIVPVLVDGVSMPSEEELPDNLKGVAFINAAHVDTGRDFRQHMDRLIRAMDAMLKARAAKRAALAPKPSPPVRPKPEPAAVPLPAPAAGRAPARRQVMLALAAAAVLAGGALGAFYLLTASRTDVAGLDQPAATPPRTDEPASQPRPPDPTPRQTTPGPDPAPVNPAVLPRLRWKLQNSYPKATATTLPFFAKRVSDVSGGRMAIEVLPVGAVVPAFQVAEAVHHGILELGYVPSQFLIGKHSAFALMTAIPFGFAPREQLAFRQRTDVKAAFDELVSKIAKLNVVVMPCGSFGRSGELWLRKQVRATSDFRGQKLRFVGLATNIYQELGSVVTALPGGEIIAAIDRGLIDGGQFSGPKADLDLGFSDVLKYYHYPSVIMPAQTVDLYINKPQWNALPSEGRAVIEMACREAIEEMIIEQDRTDRDALSQLAMRQVFISPMPATVEHDLYVASQKVLTGLRRNDAFFDRVMKFFDQMRASTVAPRPL